MKNSKKTPAAYIKEALKKAFPGVKFSCRYQIFSWWDSVDVYWIWGPTRQEVEKIAKKFQAWTFDSYTDSYEYFDNRPEGQTAKYVLCERKPAPNEWKEILAEVEEIAGTTWEKLENSIDRTQNRGVQRDTLCCILRQFLKEKYDYNTASEKALVVLWEYLQNNRFITHEAF